MNIILGAGLSGLICGALNAQSRIFERNSSSFVSHRAVLRFRDEKIARSIGIPFRRVTVRKGIWLDGHDSPPSPRLANLYSQKVRSIIAESSIWNLTASERYIAPDDLHAQLADICSSRVEWGHEVNQYHITEWRTQRKTIISTIPLPLLLKLLDPIHPAAPLPVFRHSPIFVSRYTVPDCDVFQTIYFPSPESGVYRATLTGSLLTIEGTTKLTVPDRADVVDAFGLSELAQELVDHRQSFGKIAPVVDGHRKALLHSITLHYGIYSLGRFATWRNILLDDVFEDIAAIRKMMTQSQYDVNLERTKV